MNNVVIDNRDLNFLVASKLDSDIIDCLKNNSVIQHGNVHLSLDKAAIERILDFINTELTINGFNENDEPNDYGIMLENLNDKFSREYYNETE